MVNWTQVLVCFLRSAAVTAGFHALAAQSLSPQYVTTVWQGEQGLPQSTVFRVVQDRQGYLWLATWGGLARFDGVRFRVFGSADIPGLGNGMVRSVFQSRSGALWAGTRTGTLIRMQDGVSRTFTRSHGLPGQVVSSIREDAAGKLWINTAGAVAYVDGEKLIRYSHHQGKAVEEFFLQARDGSVWFRCGQEIVRFGADGSPKAVAGGYLVQETSDGSVWIGSFTEDRLVRYHLGRLSEVRLPVAKRPQWTGAFSGRGVFAMAQDVDGELLLVTSAGLFRVVNGRMSGPERLRLPPELLERPKVLSLMVDREGNRWVGTFSTGLFRFRPAAVTSYGKEEGLTDEPFNCLLQDREGRIWLGGDSLHWFDGREFHRFHGLADIRTIAQTRDGNLWFGGSGGLYRWRSGVLSRFKIDAPAVDQIMEDHQGTLWVQAATYDRPGGQYRFRNERLERAPEYGERVRMALGRGGGVWLAAPPVLRHIQNGKTVLYDERHGLPANNSYSDFYEEPDGTLWIGAYGAGLYRFKNARAKAITPKDGLPNDSPTGMVADGRGHLWVCSNQNIFQLSLADLNRFADGKARSITPVLYGAGEGMRSIECNAGKPGGWKTRDGRIWFPTMRGVVAVDPSAANPHPPPVVIEEAWAGTLALGNDGRTSAPPGYDTFDFRFTALSLSAPEKQRFRYRLEPYENQWKEAGTERTAHYTNMRPGRYRFKVMAANSYGVWNDEAASLPFVLEPHYYQTNWFFLLCAGALAALVWAAFQRRVRQLQREFNMAAEARVEERMRIARDLHDTLLQGFHGLLLRLQAAYNLLPNRGAEARGVLESTIDDAARAITEARDAVQDLRSQPLLCTDLVKSLTALGQNLLARQQSSTRTPPQFAIDVEGRPTPMDADCRDEIFRIASEALRNAFEHSRARRIEVEIRYGGGGFRLRVRDDGRGIDQALLRGDGRTGHWGMIGMRERAGRIGAKLEVWSESDAGTEVELSVPASIVYEQGGRRQFQG
ncbi:MAG: two-component regulator propeller domain-containing protein [Bryobacteraceae bacterium]|nr:two-component regulator propeller domain-containing protein [Bryobacteraceae bacterium]